MRKRVVATALAKHGLNPLMRRLAGYIPGWALVETTGRRSGRPHRVPVGDGLRDGAFWIVAEHGRRADYVRNLEADPAVRVRVRGRWRRGVAWILDDDDARARTRWLGGMNPVFVRVAGTDLLTVRIDLEPTEHGERTIVDVAREGAVAGLAAGIVGGIPSTLHSLATGQPVLRTLAAAGNVVAPTRSPRRLLMGAGVGTHAGISAGWGIVLAATLPRKRTLAWGLCAGAAIAALDLGVVGRVRPLVRGLPQLPQVADHLVYGLVAAALIRGYRRDVA